MASISGAQTSAAVKVASTWGTAVSVGAGNKLAAEITPNFNADELSARMIGTGRLMTDFATIGNFKPSISLAMDGGYRNQMDVLLAQMLGTSGAPVEQTGSQGDYKHTISFNSTLNAKYVTLVHESASATVYEYPTCAVQSVNFSLDDAPGILEFGAELIANNVVLSSPTNNNAAVQAATFTETNVERIQYSFDDLFRINLNSGGALAGGDNFSITSYNLTLTRPQEIIGEIKGSTGNGAPISAGLFEGELTIGVKELADHTYLTYWANQTALKCSLNVQGTQIGSGVNKALTILIPKMQLVTEPQYALTSEGVNPLSMTFKLLYASTNPTGMTSGYPYIEVINTLSTSLLA